MLRKSLLYLSHQPRIFRFVRNNRLAKRLASRFVAGETIASACDAVAELNRKRITASLDLLRESVGNEAEARATGRQYVELLDEIARRKLDAKVSVKLTSLGQDIRDDLCEEITRSILTRAKSHGSFVRLDMEGSAYTQRTLDFFAARLQADFPDTVGIVLQSALRRTLDDVEWAIGRQCRVRICKGAYLEPATVAFPSKRDVDATFVEAMQRLMERGRYPGIATHDDVIIGEARRHAVAKGIGPDRFEFQMLYGVRRDLQEQLVAEGWRLRVYVPFGTQWYPYLMRRLAERPANIAFITGNVMREMVSRRRSA
ncbi:MAG: proline dehydrogenase family protein [Gemmatimonadaceae bacterium]